MTPPTPDKKKSANNYVRFSGLAVQMGIIIGAGAYGGSYLDEKYGNETPVWTIVCSLAAIGIALYLVIKEVIKISKDND